MMQKTCFVIMGFGEKTNYKTGHTFNLDKTYKNIIKPVFEDLNFLCFRADEIPNAGNIDVVMYENILKADFVVADISTLNPNAFYELGIRHALKKNTTMIIAEKGTEFPFDVNHNTIDMYEHLGPDIGVDEAQRFKSYLTDKVKALLDNPKTDSPVYTYLPNLETPTFTEEEIEELKNEIEEESTSVADFIDIAETAKNNQEYITAIHFLKKARERYPNNDFINQRLILNTYKSKKPDETSSLLSSEKLLESLNIDITTDPETLGLAGAIYKRLYTINKDNIYLEKALWNYSKGFYVKQDYYNGINLIYLLLLKASISSLQLHVCANYGRAIEVIDHVNRICLLLLESKDFNERDDKEWIYFTLAEIAFIQKRLDKEEIYLNQAIKESKGSFSLDSYKSQKERLKGILKSIKSKQQLKA